MAPDSSSSSYLPPPHSLPSSADDWFLPTSEFDNHILSQAFTRELSSMANPPCSASSSSPPEPLSSSSLELRHPWHIYQASKPEALWVVRALQQQQKQQVSINKDCLEREKSSQAFSHASTEHSESCFDNNNSSLSSNSTIASLVAMPNNTVRRKPQTPTGHHLPAFSNTMTASTENPSPDYSMSPSNMALSSQAAVGSGTARVSKRRSRISNKAPIAVLSTDASNFRAMVQQLTGIPSGPSVYPNYGSQMLAGSGAPLLKPYPSKLPYMSECGNLPPTLDTSASLLGRKRTPLHAPFSTQGLAGSVDKATEGGFVIPPSLMHHRTTPTGFLSLWDSLPTSEPRRGFLPTNEMDEVPVMPSSADCYSTRESPTSSDSLVMEPIKSTFSAIDSWLITFDGALASHAPSMEIARMA